MSSDDALPAVGQSTSHVLRPHHIGLLAVLLLTSTKVHAPGSEPYSIPLQLHVHRILLHEVAEIYEPRSYQQLIKDIVVAPGADIIEVRRLAATLTSVAKHLHTADKFADFFADIRALIMDRDEIPAPHQMDRRSFFGLFARRCYLTFVKMSFEAATKLRVDFYYWSFGNNPAAHRPIGPEWDDRERFIFPAEIDEKRHPQTEAYGRFEKYASVGNTQAAADHLRDFFNQQFSDTRDSLLRQHSLLNMGRLHFAWGEWDAARKVLLEGIAVSRTNGDKMTLHYCMNLLRRLPTNDGSEPQLTVIQEHTHSFDVLWDVKKIMDSGQPLAHAFEKLVEATAVHDMWADKPDPRPPPPPAEDQWANHAVQAILWREAGQEVVAQTEENIVLTFTPAGSDNDARLSALFGRARQYARQGSTEDALVTLLEPAAWVGLNLRQYHDWADEVWNILMLTVSRKGQNRQYYEYFRPRKPSAELDLKAFLHDAPGDRHGMLEAALQKCMDAKRLGGPTMGTEPLMTALGEAKASGHWALYRVGVVMLADIGLDSGIASTVRETLEECLPQLMLGEDLEQRAYAAYTYARCLLMEGKGSAESLSRALPYLQTAEEDYAHLQLPSSLMAVQFMLTVVLHNMGGEYHQQRDEAATRRSATLGEAARWAKEKVDEQFQEVMTVIAQVGTLLATR
ncbi:hypothetical protein AURDEDRAFT_157608 [Auricularia subglabra TFB-10046 SS5]|nr:hypothetical protein AURDEDRAFT_157608 [Auricularia subglabra TFB-10046 SS5]